MYIYWGVRIIIDPSAVLCDGSSPSCEVWLGSRRVDSEAVFRLRGRHYSNSAAQRLEYQWPSSLKPLYFCARRLVVNENKQSQNPDQSCKTKSWNVIGLNNCGTNCIKCVSPYCEIEGSKFLGYRCLSSC